MAGTDVDESMEVAAQDAYQRIASVLMLPALRGPAAAVPAPLLQDGGRIHHDPRASTGGRLGLCDDPRPRLQGHILHA